MPDRKHILMNKWHLIQNQHSLRKIFKNPCNKRPRQETAECLSEKIRKYEASISKLRTHSEKGTCPKTMLYNARANITTDDDFKRDITFIRKKAQQKYIDALIKFHYRRGERNKVKLNRIKQLQSNLIVQMALLLRVFSLSKLTVHIKDTLG